MKKLIHVKQDSVITSIQVNGGCTFCGLIKDCVVVAFNAPVSVCRDCAKQITRIITKHGPASGQIPTSPNGPVPPEEF